MAVSSQRISAAYRYGIALGAVVMAAAIRAALEPVLGQEALYLPFLLAVLLVGRFEGHGPAFLATGLSTICTAWLFLAPWHSFSIASPAARVGLALFVVIGIAMSILTGNVRTSLLSASETAETLRKHIRMLNPQPEGGDAFRQVLPERDTKEKRGSSFRAKLKRTPHFLWLGLAALAVVLQAGSFWSIQTRFSGREQWSFHTHQVLEKIESLVSTLNEAEARQRGYLLTGDERGLTSYRESLEEIPPRLDDLQELTSDNPRQQARIRELRRLIAARNLVLEKDIELRQSRGPEAVGEFIRTGPGKPLREQIQKRLGEMKNEESLLLEGRNQATLSSARTMAAVLVSSSSLLLIVLLAGSRVIGREISARQQDVELSASLAAIVDSTDDAIIGESLDGLILSWNRGAEKLYGYTAAEVLGRPSLLLSPPELPDEMGAVLRHISRGKKTERYETVRVAKDGRRIEVAITSSPIINRMGELIGVSAITRDITDRKRAEEAVRERERTLFRFTEAAPVAIAMFDRNMRFLAVSQRFREDYRLGEQELLGHSFYEFFPGIPQSWHDVHQRCLAGAVEQNPETPFTRADASEQWIRWEIQPWRQTDGTIGGIVLFSEDITQQKRARDAVRESEQQFQTLANAIPQLCSMATGDGSVFWYNQRWYEYTGTTSEEMERRGWQSVHDPEVLPEVLERWNHSLRSGEPFEMVFPLRGADGVFRPFLTRVVPLRDRDGKVTRWFGTNTDISEQQTTEEKLRHALEQLDQAMEAGDLGAWDYRLETAEIFWDDRCRNMLGVRAGDRIDHEAEIELIHPEDRAAVVEAKRQALAGSNDGVYHREFRVIWPDGSVHWLASHGRAFFEDSGNARRAVRFIGVKMDITERKHAERQILELNATLERRVRERTAQLEDANRELEAFSYSVSHDLRAPLRSVEGFAKILLRDYPGKFLDETAADYMNRMSVATQRMGQLISDLLALSRLTRQEISRQPVNLSDIADSILKEYSRGEPGRNVQLEIEPGLVAYADPALTRVALENLLRNAWKYTSKTCTATIAFGGGASNSKKEATFFVRDNGAGFDMAHANQLFAPFQRLHRNEEFEGTGIGLATVQRIIRRHGGRVWADAKPGQGAVFFFTLGGGHDTNGQHAVGGG